MTEEVQYRVVTQKEFEEMRQSLARLHVEWAIDKSGLRKEHYKNTFEGRDPTDDYDAYLSLVMISPNPIQLRYDKGKGLWISSISMWKHGANQIQLFRHKKLGYAICMAFLFQLGALTRN